jgi:glycosyltransferase involved in cell wall biosynthesis
MLNDKPLISCIIVTYRHFEYLFHTINSVLMQDYTNIELIVADDGSVQFPQTQIFEYIDRNNPGNVTRSLVYSNESNLGTVKNVNKAIKQSCGEYIKVIGGDDEFYDNFVFSKQVEYLQANRDVLAVTGLLRQCSADMHPIFDRRVEFTNKVLENFLRTRGKKAYRYYIMKAISPLATQAMCFSRSFFKAYGFYNEMYTLIEDASMAAYIIRNEIDVGYIGSYCVKHRTKVGVSANDKVFSPNRIKYYQDCVKYTENELLPYPELVEKRYAQYRYKVAKFRYDMCVCIMKNGSKSDKLKLIFGSLDALLLYALSYPGKAGDKLVSFMKHA